MGPDWNRGPWSLDSQSLFERAIDRSEVGIDGAAERIDYGDNRKRNARGDQAVFDCRCTGLIGPELGEATPQFDLPLSASDLVIPPGQPDT
jgi:hypothetical protein